MNNSNNKLNVNSEELEIEDIFKYDFTNQILNKGSKSNKKIKAKEDAVELQYSNYFSKKSDFSVSNRQPDPIMYQWQGSYWKQQLEAEGQSEAFDWLKINAPDKARFHTAKECSKTVLIDRAISKLPIRPKETYIPFMDRWLYSDEFGNFVNIEPDKNIGITYHIKSKLNSTDCIYIPKELPEDSFFSRYLNSSLPNKEVRDLLQEYCGYTLMGDTRFQKALVNTGPGGSGKSVILHIIKQLHEKVEAVSLDNLKGFGLHHLIDTSLVISAETPTSGIDEEILKACISGDIVSVEKKNINAVSYEPHAKWIINCNTFPKLKDRTNALWRRLLVIEWNEETPEYSKLRIHNLPEIIAKDEIHLVIDWCLIGLSRLLRRGHFDPPNIVKDSIDKEIAINNNVIGFTEDVFLEMTDDKDKVIQKDLLYNRYKKYCDDKSLNAYGPEQFWKLLNTIFKRKMVTTRRTLKVKLEGSEGWGSLQKYYVNLFYRTS